jgi:hypothetical protein
VFSGEQRCADCTWPRATLGRTEPALRAGYRRRAVGKLGARPTKDMALRPDLALTVTVVGVTRRTDSVMTHD